MPTPADVAALWDDRATRSAARDAAVLWLAEHPELEERYRNYDIVELVGLVDAARAAKDEETRQELDAYLLAKHPPQNLVGVM